MSLKINRIISSFGLFCVAGAVNAACLIGEESNAVGVQADSGQGNYDCSVLTSPSGTQLVDFFATGKAGWTIDAATGTVSWEALSYPDPETGILKTAPVYFVSTNNSGQGKRCNYLYDGAETAGAGLGADSGSVNAVTICGDPSQSVVVEEEQSTIITTADQSCTASIDYDGGGVVPDVTIGFTSAVDGQTIAVCGTTASSSSLALGLGQRECTPPPYRQTGISLTESCFVKDSDGTPTGEIDLLCAPVDIAGAPLDGPEYCWYYENRVCESDLTGYCDGRTQNTFIPKSKKDTLNVQIDTFDGSTCYTYYLYGRAYFHCF